MLGYPGSFGAGAVKTTNQRCHGAPGMTQADIDIRVPMQHAAKELAHVRLRVLRVGAGVQLRDRQDNRHRRRHVARDDGVQLTRQPGGDAVRGYLDERRLMVWCDAEDGKPVSMATFFLKSMTMLHSSRSGRATSNGASLSATTEGGSTAAESTLGAGMRARFAAGGDANSSASTSNSTAL